MADLLLSQMKSVLMLKFYINNLLPPFHVIMFKAVFADDVSVSRIGGNAS